MLHCRNLLGQQHRGSIIIKCVLSPYCTLRKINSTMFCCSETYFVHIILRCKMQLFSNLRFTYQYFVFCFLIHMIMYYNIILSLFMHWYMVSSLCYRTNVSVGPTNEDLKITQVQRTCQFSTF